MSGEAGRNTRRLMEAQVCASVTDGEIAKLTKQLAGLKTIAEQSDDKIGAAINRVAPSVGVKKIKKKKKPTPTMGLMYSILVIALIFIIGVESRSVNANKELDDLITEHVPITELVEYPEVVNLIKEDYDEIKAALGVLKELIIDRGKLNGEIVIREFDLTRDFIKKAITRVYNKSGGRYSRLTDLSNKQSQVVKRIAEGLKSVRNTVDEIHNLQKRSTSDHSNITKQMHQKAEDDSWLRGFGKTKQELMECVKKYAMYDTSNDIKEYNAGVVSELATKAGQSTFTPQECRKLLDNITGAKSCMGDYGAAVEEVQSFVSRTCYTYQNCASKIAEVHQILESITGGLSEIFLPTKSKKNLSNDICARNPNNWNLLEQK